MVFSIVGLGLGWFRRKFDEQILAADLCHDSQPAQAQAPPMTHANDSSHAALPLFICDVQDDSVRDRAQSSSVEILI